MSAADEECSFLMHTDNYIGCSIANADSVSMDFNDDDNQTVGCAIAHAAHADFLSNSNSKDDSDEDYDSSCAETCNPVGLKSDKGERVYYWLAMLKKKYTFINHTVRNIQ